MGPPQGVPKIMGIPVPCCEPSAVELLHRRTLGPVQTLVLEFEFILWGGKDHENSDDQTLTRRHVTGHSD